MPAATPGTLSGSTTWKKVAQGRAPRLAAISSISRGMASIDSRTARTNSGKAITAAASTAPVQRKARLKPNHCSSAWPIAPWRPNSISST